MKKLLFLAACLLSLTCLHAQTFTSGRISVTISDSMAYDSTQCGSYFELNYLVTVSSSFTGDSVNIVDTSCACLVGGTYYNVTGVTPWVFVAPIQNLALYQDNPITPGYAYFYTGTMKIVAGADTLRYITAEDSLMVANACSYQMVQGNVYADNNGDCMLDSGDVPLSPPNVSLTENLSSSVGSRTVNCGCSPGTGWYYFYAQQSWMVNYTVFMPSYYAFIFPYSSCFSGSYTLDTLPATDVNFPLQCTSNVDVQCYALSPAGVRLHRPFYMQPYISNTGCDSASGQLAFIIDSRVAYDSSLSTYPADIVHGDTLIWNYANLTNLTAGAYWNSFLSSIYLIPDSTLAAGDTLCFSGYTNIPPADINPANNSFAFCLPVVYSYDPNVKQVTPVGTGPQGYIPAGPDTLAYDLHFQNTGSDLAQNIVVIDTLDSHINATSLRVLGTSANMAPAWLAPHVVQFNFNNINLPDSSSNEPASHGSVRFSVALNTGIAPGTQIKNTGYIYFDENPAVVTNTTLNTIALPNGIDPVIAGMGVDIYPNPATDHITVENLSGGEITIMNVNGDVVVAQVIVNNKTTIDVNGLPDGVYILKTTNANNTATTKFIKY